jgi:hypothetical protein
MRLARQFVPLFPQERIWLPLEMAIDSGIAATSEILGWWLRHPRNAYSVEQVADYLDALVVGPLTLSKPPKRPALVKRRK